MTQGRTYTVRAVFKVDPDTEQDSYLWRFFCESKWFNEATNKTEFIYPFVKNPDYIESGGKVFKTVRVSTGARRTGLPPLCQWIPSNPTSPFPSYPPTDPPPPGDHEEEGKVEKTKG
jgi:hypothetical protein